MGKEKLEITSVDDEIVGDMRLPGLLNEATGEVSNSTLDLIKGALDRHKLLLASLGTAGIATFTAGLALAHHHYQPKHA